LARIYSETIYRRLLGRLLQFVEAKQRQQPGERGGTLELEDERDFFERLDRAGPEETHFAELDPVKLPPEADLSQVEAEQFRQTLEFDPVVPAEAEAIANSLRTEAEIEQDRASRGATVQGSRQTLMSPEVLEQIRREAPDPAERGLVSTTTIITGAVWTLARVIKRLAQGRDHGVYCTCVEELLRQFYLANAGQLVWDWMKQDTAAAFGPDPTRHGGTAFVQQLAATWQPGQRVILVGHSTGAIAICHLLAATQSLPPGLKFEVVFLAPAVTCRLLADTLALHGERIAQFRLFGLHDDWEVQDSLLGQAPVYPRSLLYLVSGLLEDEPDAPLAGMQRYFNPAPPFSDPTTFPAIEQVRRFLTAAPGRTLWSIAYDGPGLNSGARSHGAFDDEDGPTLTSLQHIIKEGF
jgi:hypothetical protein